MDIKALKPVNEDDGVFEHFRDAAGELLYDGEGDAKTKVGAVVSGTYSKYFRDAQRKMKKAAYASARRNENPTDEELAEAELAQEHAVEAACIRSWTFTADGGPFPICAENWTALVADQPHWRFQVQRRMHDHASFFKRA